MKSKNWMELFKMCKYSPPSIRFYIRLRKMEQRGMVRATDEVKLLCHVYRRVFENLNTTQNLG